MKNGSVRKQARDTALANALIKSSEKSFKNIKRIKIDELNAESVISDSYDIMRELIEAKMALDSYKSYSHEATISFLKKFDNFNEKEIVFLDNLRKIRNGIKYYGQEANEENASNVVKFMTSILPKLKKLLEDNRG